jgi:allophanate hydrolase
MRLETSIVLEFNQRRPGWQHAAGGDFLIFTIAEVEADPIALNSRLGTYTNFVNLMEVSAVAVPNGFRTDGMPLGITLIAPPFEDTKAASIAAVFHRATGLKLGGTSAPHPS